MQDKFCVTLSRHSNEWPTYFVKFYITCDQIAYKNKWHVETVINRHLKPHGRLIVTKTQGWYLRWDDEKYHNLFALKWS